MGRDGASLSTYENAPHPTLPLEGEGKGEGENKKWGR
jgi:hypothetical protein